MTSIRLIMRPWLSWAARRALVGRNRSRGAPEEGRFMRADVGHILDLTWQGFDALARALPSEPTLGTRMNMQLACVSLAFFRALTAVGIERGYAVELTADAAWVVYEKWGAAARLAGRLCARGRVARLRLPVNLFLRFPFNPPGYRFERRPADDGIAFDIVRCPIAEYFAGQGATDLCVQSWCNLDYPLAEMWGGRLTRSGTLAGGATRCDFRFSVASSTANRRANESRRDRALHCDAERAGLTRVEEPTASAASRRGAQGGAEPSCGGDHGAN